MQQNQNKEVIVLGFLITSKPVHTIKQETMFFHTVIDPASDWLHTVFLQRPPDIKIYQEEVQHHLFQDIFT